MRRQTLFALALLFSAAASATDNCSNLPAPAVLSDNGLERTPMLGWNSWQISGFQSIFPTETMIKTQTDAFVSTGLAAVYSAFSTPYIQQDGWWPEGTRDGSGNIRANLTNFPSGMASLVSYVHGKGLSFGIHTSPYTQTCSGFMASGLHEQQDANTFASWGVDQVKYDGCSVDLLYPSCYVTSAPQIWQYFAQFVRATGRPMAIQTGYVPSQWGGNVWDYMQGVGVNQVRVEFLLPTGDIGTSWTSYDKEIDTMASLASYQKPGYFMDSDIEPYNWTGNQRWTHFAMDALWSSPVLIAADLTTLTGGTCGAAASGTDLYTFCNSEVIAVDQDKSAKMATRISHTACGSSWCDVWVKPLSTGQWAVGLLNRDSASHSITASFANYGGTPSARDLYAHSNLGSLTGYTTTVGAYGTSLILLTPTGSTGTILQRQTAQRTTVH